ncbi:chymotrypsin inhibitor SCI-III precursor [Bombyx mori]|nr:chymotrypsin inhibitor SCI-III precursor [Bombyx mori]AAO17293.1 chymotrypsin inhibitor CI13 [Bombyx mori]
MLRSVLFLFAGVFFAACLTSVMSDEPTTDLPICEQAFGDAGLCFGYMKLYSYNQETKNCEEFIYGGCQGNDNRFSTLAECEQKCIN